MEIRRKTSQSRFPKNVVITVSLIVAVCSALVFVFFFQDSSNEVVAVDNDNFGKTSYAASNSNSNNNHSNRSDKINKNESAQNIKNKIGLRIPVLYPKYSIPRQQGVDDNDEIMTSSVTVKLVEDLTNSPSVVELIALDMDNPPEFIKTCGAFDGKDNPVERIEVLKKSKQPHLAIELLKYCAMEHYRGGLFIDSQSTLSSTVDHILAKTTPGGGTSRSSLAVLNDPKISPKSIHGALLYIADYSNKSPTKSTVVEGMIQLLMTTNVKVLESSPLLITKSLYDLIAKDMKLTQLVPRIDPSKNTKNNHWYLFQHTCSLFSLGQRQLTAPISPYALNSHRLTQNCPEPNGFCCSIYDPITYSPVMMTKHLLLPYQVLPSTSGLPKPLNAKAGHFEEEDLPYISTISERIHKRLQEQTLITPNFFETLLQNDCLPSGKECSDCLRNKKGSNCKICASACPCYCKALCHIQVEEKFVSKSLVVNPPLYAKEPSRLIPRIVHQTYFETVTPEKYPNMSRLIESFKQSGWEYNFYTDEMSLNFLRTHFPPEVRQAYETLRPGAFKADLFRYCVLLIHGGVYADVDIMLEANLDLAVGPDIGFMVPQDEPGEPVNRRMCLWNGFIAAAPGHPFLAKTIETVVNNIRNRFTGVDTDSLFCPNPELSVLHAFDTLFTAGPCILGAMVNKVLGRHGQTSFEAGEIDLWERSKQAALEKGTEFIISVDDKPNDKIPGRTIVLHQSKWDMGSHRFTFLEKNLVVAATDLPDADDTANHEKPQEHYSKTHVKAGIYGLDRLYTDDVRANEELRFYVDAQWSRFVMRNTNSNLQTK